jgi:hypothetical protein
MRRPAQRRKQVLGDLGRGRDHVLAVVEHDEHLAVADQLGQPGRVRELERGGDRGADAGRIADGRQLDQATAELRSADSARAASNASRVLPTPPGPTRVTNR